MTIDRNGWSLPTFAKVGVVGVLCFLLLFLLGAIPLVSSPIARIENAIADHHRQAMGPLRLICKAAWKDNPAMQVECER